MLFDVSHAGDSAGMTVHVDRHRRGDELFGARAPACHDRHEGNCRDKRAPRHTALDRELLCRGAAAPLVNVYAFDVSIVTVADGPVVLDEIVYVQLPTGAIARAVNVNVPDGPFDVVPVAVPATDATPAHPADAVAVKTVFAFAGG